MPPLDGLEPVKLSWSHPAWMAAPRADLVLAAGLALTRHRHAGDRPGRG
jgi:hypothetical protein